MAYLSFSVSIESVPIKKLGLHFGRASILARQDLFRVLVFSISVAIFAGVWVALSRFFLKIPLVRSSLHAELLAVPRDGIELHIHKYLHHPNISILLC